MLGIDAAALAITPRAIAGGKHIRDALLVMLLSGAFIIALGWWAGPRSEWSKARNRNPRADAALLFGVGLLLEVGIGFFLVGVR